MNWKQIAEEKRASVLANIPKDWQIPAPPSAQDQRDVTGSYIQQYLTAREVEITETPAASIVEKASSGQWTAVEITKAFCHRAAVAHQLVSCLHEIFFDDAIETAKQLDHYLEKNKKPLGSLHGLPVSLKDQFHVRGVETSMGYVGWIGTFQGEKGTGKEKVYESEMVKELRDLGAVFYCKTSVPHTLMCGETVNNIIGYTHNPTNRNLSSGGSSGGEGALLALRGSPVGFGTDIGGSIRIPAAFNGLYGLRPSTGRLPYEGMANSFDGGPGVISVVGPLAPNIGALKLVFQGLLSKEPWFHDPLVHDLPYRPEVEEATFDLARSKKLCFAVIRHDGYCGVHPPVTRAVEKTIEALTKAGHKVVDWKPTTTHAQLAEVTGRCYLFDGGRDAKKAFDLSGEDMAPQVIGPYKETVPESSASEVMATLVEKRELQKAYMEYWNSTVDITGTGRPVDAIICPVAPFAAAIPEKYHYYGYGFWVNLLDYSSVVVPVLKADKTIDKVDKTYKPLNDDDKKTYETYDPELYDGAHVSVQLVGRRLQEEKMLTLADYVGGLLHS
ncbi:amidase [Myriangium duriaei CBS 260.36]|uniref:amidase n=1 Tax=Myriangium duriaei CBS 260.36 TaxID=1168546 RepID=A0A9P4ISY9_9PEZI|nr:amidase [Myriangium duriaei CBS 260.36]